MELQRMMCAAGFVRNSNFPKPVFYIGGAREDSIYMRDFIAFVTLICNIWSLLRDGYG